MSPDVVVVRHKAAGGPALLAKHLDEWMRYWDANIRNRSKKS